MASCGFALAVIGCLILDASSRHLATVAPAAAPSPGTICTGTTSPELTDGPYYLDDELFRNNVTEGQAGVPLELRIKVVDTNCQPVGNALVDIWHANATGYYSGYTGIPNDNTTFLRGVSYTEENGTVTFNTLIPGWYSGRAVHVHCMVHVPKNLTAGEDITPETEKADYEAARLVHVGQFFFDEAFYETVQGLQPYAQHSSVVRTTNAEDSIYGGDTRTILATQLVGSSVQDGVVGDIVVVINPNSTVTANVPGGGGSGGSMPSGSGMPPGGFGGMPGPRPSSISG